MKARKAMALLTAGFLTMALAACGSTAAESDTASAAETTESSAEEASETTESASAAEEATAQSAATETTSFFKIGICNYVDHASLNQIVNSIEEQLAVLGEENQVDFEVSYDNCNADANVMGQIIANFQADQVDLMVGVATPVAMGMQAATEEIPIVFSAVSDPIGAELVDSLEAPGANITGTSDALNTNAIMDLVFVQNPEAANIGLLYDVGQDASTAAIAEAKAYLEEKGISYKEYTGTNAEEVLLAVQSAVADDVDALFTPTDNTIMDAESSFAQILAEAEIPHYTGADSFALNGAFLGYGVDYAKLGEETANMIADILLNGKDAGSVPVMTFDNGIATINTETAEAMGIDYEEIAAAFAPYCTQVLPITTADNFSDLEE